MYNNECVTAFAVFRRKNGKAVANTDYKIRVIFRYDFSGLTVSFHFLDRNVVVLARLKAECNAILGCYCGINQH